MDNSKFRWCGNALIGVGMMLVVWAIGVSVWPKSYRASSLVSVDKSVDRDGPSFHKELSRDFDPNWFSFQVEEMQSKPVLYQVITNLHLNEKGVGKGLLAQNITTAYTALKRRIDINSTRGTALFEISVTCRDPNEAANISNEIANVYRDQVRERDKAASLHGIDLLEKELPKQAAQTNRLTAELAILTDKSSPEGVRKTKELESAMLVYKRIEERVQSERNMAARVQMIESAIVPTRPVFPSLRLVIGSWCLALTSILAGFLLRRS